MPIYEYYCNTCKKMVEHYCVNYHGTKRQCCPKCKAVMKKEVSAIQKTANKWGDTNKELSWEGDAGEYRTNRTTV